jgi:hypothetical protein
MHAETLVAIVHAVAALAQAGVDLARGWRALAEELGATPGAGEGASFTPGAFRFECEHEGRRVAVETDEDRARGTRVRRILGPETAPAFELAPGEALGDHADGKDAAEAAWRTLQPAHLSCRGQDVSVVWPGYRPDVTRVRAALDLLAAVRTGTPGPYR